VHSSQEESRKTSERVKWGQKRRMEEGVVFGRDMLGYDVRGGKMYINEDGAKIVRLIFQKFVQEGKGSHTIARELQEAGYKTITGNTKWTNTVIYKTIRNEKYAGDLVQKKTFTPDYLSHEKKYNKGEEKFVIIKDHHEPIVSREVFDAANRLLDSRSLSQAGKAKHSNRYCFSGKIKCGKCNSTYVARYRKRQDGSTYKSWCCLEGAKYGRPQVDKAGNHLGCSTESIRDEDALHIMHLVANSLELEKKTIAKNMLNVIEAVVSRDMAATDTEKLRERITEAEEKKARLLELYIGKEISREEFVTARAKCDTEIDELNELTNSIEKQSLILKAQQELLADITVAVNEIVEGMALDEEFYRNLLDRMIVHDKDHIDVYLNLLPYKWSYTVSQAVKAINIPEVITENEGNNGSGNMLHLCTRSGNRRDGPHGNDRRPGI
jgi:hypothetical protein